LKNRFFRIGRIVTVAGSFVKASVMVAGFGGAGCNFASRALMGRRNVSVCDYRTYVFVAVLWGGWHVICTLRQR